MPDSKFHPVERRTFLKLIGAAASVTAAKIAVAAPTKRIAITIDDGPSLTYTIKAMDACEKYGGKLTFFVEGTYCQREPQIIKLMQKRGHQIGNHSFDHANLAKLPEDKVRYQLGHTNDVIGQHRMLAVCTYSPAMCGPKEIVDVIDNHEFALIKRGSGRSSGARSRNGRRKRSRRARIGSGASSPP